MAKKKQDFTDDDFKQLMREINKRIIIAGIAVSIFGVLFALVVHLIYR